MMSMMGQSGAKGPDPMSADGPARTFAPLDELTDTERNEVMQRAFEKLKASFDKLARPDGTKTAPSKTCKHLKTAHPTKPSGDYWIDPNGNDVNDAIMVHCDMQTGSTCVQPRPALSQEITITSTESDMWVGEVPNNAFDINYKADSNQMNFLQLLSTKAEQTITFHCKNTVAHLNPRGNKRNALTLMAWNDLELKHRGKAKYNVLTDECQHKKNSWAQTIFKIDSAKPSRLPIVDIKVEDFGRSNQAFKVEIGQVCFN